MSIRLRAERINRIRIEKERHNDFNKISNLEYELNSVKKTNQQIIDSKDVTIDKLTDYANTLFKDLKGALEMNAKLMEAMKGLEQEEQPNQSSRDWSVPQVFPEGYIISVGTNIIAVSDSSSHPLNATGMKGVVDYSNDCIPSCVFGKEQKWMRAGELAPINPLDHPEHPQFK